MKPTIQLFSTLWLPFALTLSGSGELAEVLSKEGEGVGRYPEHSRRGWGNNVLLVNQHTPFQS